ncbi:MAG: DUF3788 domain-containing protein [Melioribacteraceae bacterium]
MKRLFLDKLEKPTTELLQLALGNSYKYWDEIQGILSEKYGKITPEWKYYGAKSGWTLKMMLKNRNLFFFGPCDKYFIIAFVFGDKAVKVIEESDLPTNLIEEIKSAKKYMEGRGLLIEIKKRKQIEDIIRLTEIKVNN